MISVKQALNKLRSYIEREKYKGFDPYDVLKSPLFKIPFFKSNKILRFDTQQFGKRFPINIRPLLRVPLGYDPVTLGLCIQAYSYLIKIYPEQEKDFLEKIDKLINDLRLLRAKGYSGSCWGYDFDWEARHAKIPAYQPSVVATGIISNALFKCYELTNNKQALDLCISTAEFISKDLNRTYEKNGDFCFSYSPFDEQIVYNASMKGVRCLSQVYSVTQNEQLKDIAKKAVSFVIKHQNEDGSWSYSNKKTGKRIDNYHTGYVLDCLDDYIKFTGDNSFRSNIEKGFHYYKNNFFENNEIPKFYNNSIYPIDCTAAAQSILSLLRFNEKDLAEKVALFMINNMQDAEGYFYFRKFNHYTIKTPYMRWSQAWMFVALSYLFEQMNK